MIQLLVNGAPTGNKIVIPAGNKETRIITVVHSQGSAAAGKLVTIESSAPTYISTLGGNLGPNGQFQFVIGPSFGTRGTVNLSVDAGQGSKKTVDVTYA